MQILVLAVLCAAAATAAGSVVAAPAPPALALSRPLIKTIIPGHTKSFAYSSTQYINALPTASYTYGFPQYAYQISHVNPFAPIYPSYYPVSNPNYFPGGGFIYPSHPIVAADSPNAPISPPASAIPQQPSIPSTPSESFGDSDSAVVDSADMSQQGQGQNFVEGSQPQFPAQQQQPQFPAADNFPSFPQFGDSPQFGENPQIGGNQEPSSLFPESPNTSFPPQNSFEQGTTPQPPQEVPQSPQAPSSPSFPQFPSGSQLPSFPQFPSSVSPTLPQFPQGSGNPTFPQFPQFPQGSLPGFPPNTGFPQGPTPTPSPPSSFPSASSEDKGINDEDTVSVDSA